MDIGTKVYKERLEEILREYADAQLTKPSDRTEFGYGLAVGEYRGLKRALKLLTDVTQEEKKSVKDDKGNDPDFERGGAERERRG